MLFFINGHVSGQLSDKKIQEVTKLREELTQGLSPKINYTPSALAEVDAIRNEILNAVKHQNYKNSALSTPLELPKVDKSASSAKDPVVASPLWDRINHSRKNIFGLFSSKQVQQQPPQHQQPQQEVDFPKSMKFLGKFNLHSNSYRDVIDLVEVQENLNFDFDEQVLVWRTIPHSMSGNKHLLLGLTNTSLVLAKLIDGIFQSVDELKLTNDVLNNNGFEAFLHWNNKEGQSEGYAVVAAHDELIWVRLGIGGEYNKLEIIWRWPIHKVIYKFKYFKHNNESLIFLSNQDMASLEIYRFALDSKEFSQIQSLPLEVQPKNIALVECKKQLLLALALTNTTKIYKYSEKFNVIRTVPSKGVTSVSGFHAGGLCFFAIAGEEPQIIRYRHNGLNKVKVQSKTYQFVRSYFPITIHTFRDDVILLVQFEVPFDTHTLSRISTLRWNGEAFETFFNVPCYMEEVLHYNGISCLIDADQSWGLSGAVILSKSNNISILVPRKEAKSGLFDLKIEIRAAPHPKEEKLIEIQMMFDYFSSLKEYNDYVFQNAKDTIKNAVLPGKPLKVTGDWTVDVLDVQNLVPEKTLTIDKPNEMDNDVVLKELYNVSSATSEQIIEIKHVIDRVVAAPAQIEPEPRNREDMVPRLQLKAVRVDELICESINGIPQEDIVWRLEDFLSLSAPLEVNTLSVFNHFEGLVNGVNITHDLVHSQNNFMRGSASIQHLVVEDLSLAKDINGDLLESISRNANNLVEISTDNLIIKNDLVVDNINGINWQSITQQMIRRDNLPPNTTLIVEGVIIKH